MHFYDVSFTRTLKLPVHVKILYIIDWIKQVNYCRSATFVLALAELNTWGPFLERPGKLTGPKSYFEIRVSRKVGCRITSNEVHFVSLADNLTAPSSKQLLKLPSLMNNKTA